MAFQQLPPPDQPKPFAELLTESARLYRQAFVPFAAAAAIGSLLAAFIAVLAPASDVANLTLLLWILAAQAPTFLAEAAVTVLALRVKDQLPAEIAGAFVVAFTMAPWYVGGKSLIWALLFIPFLIIPLGAFVLIPLSLFLLARWGLFGPLVVAEHRSIIDALRTSWNLVKGRTWLTLGRLLVLQVGVVLITLLADGIAATGPLGARIVLPALAQAVTLPFVTIFVLLLYEDYRRLATMRLTEPPNSPPQTLPPAKGEDLP